MGDKNHRIGFAQFLYPRWIMQIERIGNDLGRKTKGSKARSYRNEA